MKPSGHRAASCAIVGDRLYPILFYLDCCFESEHVVDNGASRSLEKMHNGKRVQNVSSVNEFWVARCPWLYRTQFE